MKHSITSAKVVTMRRLKIASLENTRVQKLTMNVAKEGRWA